MVSVVSPSFSRTHKLPAALLVAIFLACGPAALAQRQVIPLDGQW